MELVLEQVGDASSCWPILLHTAGEPIKYVGFTGEQAVETKVTHDAYQNGHTAHDRVNPTHRKARIAGTILTVFGGECAEDILGGFTSQREVMDQISVIFRNTDFDRNGGGNCSSHANNGRGVMCLR